MNLFKKPHKKVPAVTKRYLVTIAIEGYHSLKKEFQWSTQTSGASWSLPPESYLSLRVTAIMREGISETKGKETIHYSPKIIKTVTHKEIEARYDGE